MAESSIHHNLQCSEEKAGNAIESIHMMVEDVKQEISKCAKSAVDSGLQMADHFSKHYSLSVLEKLMTSLRETAEFYFILMMVIMVIIFMVLIGMMNCIKKHQTSLQLLEQNLVKIKELLERNIKDQGTNDVNITHIDSSFTKGNSGATAGVPVVGPPQDAVLKKSFTVFMVEGDTKPPSVYSVTVLTSGLILLNDENNVKIKVFDLQGCYLQCKKVPGWIRLTAVGISKVAVVGRGKTLDILQVKKTHFIVESRVTTSKLYNSICTVDDVTLAVGYGGPPCGVDLLDHTGKVIRSVVPQVSDPSGVANCLDGSLVVMDRSSSSLHLLNRENQWVKVLWLQPPGCVSDEDFLMHVDICERMCVCMTYLNKVYVLELQD